MLELEQLWVVDAVQALVDKSLVIRPSATRFDLLVSVQEYAAARLDEQGGRTEAELRHGRVFGGVWRHEGDYDAKYWQGFGADQDNRMTALRRALARGDGHVAYRALREAWLFLESTGPYALMISLAREVLAVPGLGPEGVAHATTVLADALMKASRHAEAGPYLEECRRRWEELGDGERLARALLGLAAVGHRAGRADDAVALFGQAQELAARSGHADLAASVALELGLVLYALGRLDEAEAAFQRAHAIAAPLGNRRSEANHLVNLGLVPAARGDLETARRWFEAGLAAHREVRSRRGEAIALGNLGEVLLGLGDPDGARASLALSVRLFEEMGHVAHARMFGDLLRSVPERATSDSGAPPR